MNRIFSRTSLLPNNAGGSRWEETGERKRHPTYPLAYSARKKDRKWPLVLRFWKGSIHSTIVFPVFVHAIIAAFVVYMNQHITSDFSVPSSIIPSLSIVVGLMLVFRNQTAYSRFWGGRLHMDKVTTAVRVLSRQILVLAPAPAVYNGGARDFLDTPGVNTPIARHMSTVSMPAIKESGLSECYLSKHDELKVIETVKILVAMLYTIKNHLRAEWGVALSPGTKLTEDGQMTETEEYKDLLPHGLKGYEHRGLGLTLQLSTFIEDFINMGVKKKWLHNAASASMLSELNTIVSSYGSMEVIRLVPIPVAHLIHHKQTLALFCGILPFAMASEMDWWAVPLVAFVAFTLYGIEGIAQTYEDPFGVAKIDINMDDIVQDSRREVEVMLAAWQSQGTRGGMFHPSNDGLASGASSVFYAQENSTEDQNLLKVTVSDLGKEIQRDTAESERQRAIRISREETAVADEESGLLSSSVGSKMSSSMNSMRPDYLSMATGSGGPGGRRKDGGSTSDTRLLWADRKRRKPGTD